MLHSPFVAGIRGLDSALEYCDKEDVVPMLLIGVRMTRTGPATVMLDVSRGEDEEDVRVCMMRALVGAAFAKLQK